MAEYIVRFLLSLPSWFLIDRVLIALEVGNNKEMIWHQWVLPTELLVEIHKLLY